MMLKFANLQTFFIGNDVPRITGDDVFVVNVGEENIYHFTVEDHIFNNDITVEIRGGIPEGGILSNNGNGQFYFTWTPRVSPTNGLTFLVRDNLKAAAILSPLVQVCACFNGGICTKEGVLMTLNPIQNLTCICTEGNYV